MIFNHWLVKTGIEIVATPLTYLVVNYLKKKESVLLDTTMPVSHVFYLREFFKIGAVGNVLLV